MIRHLNNLPATMVGFVATDEVTKEDFEAVVLPAVQELVDRTGILNYLLVLNTEIKNFTLGAWMKDALLGISHISKWNRVAIVSESEGIKTFTDLFSKVVPGEFRGYDSSELQEAINWVSGAEEIAPKSIAVEGHIK